MKFLITTKQTSMPPPEMTFALMDAMDGWVAERRASGKLDSIWSFAGLSGGGGVVDVDSHEELDEIMSTFPWAPFSSIEIYALSDLDHSLKVFRAAVERMMPAVAAR